MKLDSELIKVESDNLLEKMINYRRTLHQYPELKMETPWTESKIIEWLTKIGFSNIESGIGGHGVATYVEGSLSGKTLCLRADCDGLPIKEETGLPFESKNGNMHACGHDFHTASLLGASEIILRHKKEIKGNIKLIFQPFEEGDGGAKAMIKAGVLDGVDAIVGYHNGCNINSRYKSGDVLLARDYASANIFAFKAVFYGTGGHVCWSRSSVNPVYMAADAIAAIRKIRPEENPCICDVTICQGGVRNNSIPETCLIEGSIRSFDREEHRAMKEKCEQICREIASQYGGKVDFIVNIDLVSTKISHDLFDRFRKIVNEAYPDSPCIDLNPVPVIGEDFARYSDIVPALYYMICARPAGSIYPHHNSKFVLDEKQLAKASTLYALFALNWQD